MIQINHKVKMFVVCENCYWGQLWSIYTSLHIPTYESVYVCVAINFSGYVNPSNNLPSEIYLYPNGISFDGIQVGERIFGVFHLFLFFVEQQWEKNWENCLILYLYSLSKSNRTEGKVYSSASGNNSTPKILYKRKKRKTQFSIHKKERTEQNVQLLSSSHWV